MICTSIVIFYNLGVLWFDSSTFSLFAQLRLEHSLTQIPLLLSTFISSKEDKLVSLPIVFASEILKEIEGDY